MAGFLDSFTAAVYREYDRRIRRASLVNEYGAPHHDAHEAASHDDDAGDTTIANLPRGAALAPSVPTDADEAVLETAPPAANEREAVPPAVEALPLTTPDARDVTQALPEGHGVSAEEAEAEITNTPPGTQVQP